MIRIFFAVPIPENIKATLARFQDEMQNLSSRVKWVRPEGMHLTLKFIGEVEQDRAEQLWTALDDLDFPAPFEVTLDQPGVFPNPRRPRVLWIGLDNTGELSTVASQVDERLQQEGEEPESRKFHPHLTLGRVRGKGLPRQAIEDFLNLEVPPQPMQVDSVVCYKSDLRPGGAVYTALHTICFDK